MCDAAVTLRCVVAFDAQERRAAPGPTFHQSIVGVRVMPTIKAGACELLAAIGVIANVRGSNRFILNPPVFEFCFYGVS